MLPFASISFNLKLGINGSIIKPERKKRIPANWKGAVYFSPIFIPTKAVAHSTQAIMARKVVDLLKGMSFKSYVGFKEREM